MIPLGCYKNYTLYYKPSENGSKVLEIYLELV